MSVCEVAQEQFATVMDQSRAVNHSVPVETAPRATNGTDGRLPVTGVTWNAAMQFCNELSALPEETEAGRRYRMPTEAEWEYACRAGNREPHPWSGSRQLGDSSGEAAGIVPPLPLKPVGSYPPNAFGLHDMRGNAWEWTSDWFERAYYGRSPHDNPQGPVAGFIKVVRGGDWRFVGEPCHIDYPMLPPWKFSPVVGIRVVCEEGLVSDDAPGS
jgi:formylglycine-generating enzyme required for sulfatase activity